MASNHGQLTRDPTAEVECHAVDDRFIPLRVCDLVKRLGEACARAGHDEPAWLECVRLLTGIVAQEEASFASDVLNAYSHFNPDRDTLGLDSDETARTPEGYRAMGARLTYLLEKANFRRLDPIRLDQVAAMASARGVRVRLDPTLVDHFEIHVRGRGEVVRRRRTWRHPIHGEPFVLPVYRRLVVVGRLKGDPHLIIKMFKDIPEEDVEALLPHACVTMNWLDRLYMIGGGVGALGSTAAQVMKIISASLIVLSRLAWVVFVGAAMLMYRTFRGYRSARQQRDSQRTRHLYYQNVANNGSAVQTLMTMISQEELKEVVLACALPALSPEPPCTPAELKSAVESWLRAHFDVHVNFDIEDAIESLDRFELWENRGAMRLLPPAEMIARLRRHWMNAASQNYHLHQCNAHPGAVEQAPAAFQMRSIIQ